MLKHCLPVSDAILVRSSSAPAVSLLGDGELDAPALGQRDPRLVLANDENVGLTGGEGVVNGVLEVDDVEASVVAFTVGDDTNTAHVAAAGNHGDGAGVELDVVGDLARSQVNLDGVVDLDQRIGVADPAMSGSASCRGRGNIQPLKRSSNLPSG